MQTTTLKRTGLNVSRVVLGTMTFGGQADETTSGQILDRALDAGINFVDTANAYNKGVTEEILGRALKGRRDRVVLASKVFNKMGDAADEQGLSRKAIERAIEDTLRRLRTDYLDLYYLHAPDWNVPIEESLAAMDSLVQAGKVRFPASSNYASWQVVQMLSLAANYGYRPAAVTQPMYNLLARGIEQEYLAMTQYYGISTVVYNPLAGGLLTGKHRRQAVTPGTRFDKNKMYQDRYWHDNMFDAVDALQEIAREERRTLVSLALNWIYHHTVADCMILGATSVEQLDENLKALEEGPLSENALRGCDAIWDALRGPAPKYNR
ncbi:MAG TPA: aldo/keto reductase [Bryobacteraceae bacterium]|nr:aldo/keto reductase [Bryobacteraceae bacterium]